MDPTLKNALLLYAFLVTGVFLAVAPWTPVWYEATVWLLPTRFGLPAQHWAVRAAVSALGLLDLVAAASSAFDLFGFRRGEKG